VIVLALQCKVHTGSVTLGEHPGSARKSIELRVIWERNCAFDRKTGCLQGGMPYAVTGIADTDVVPIASRVRVCATIRR